MENTLENKARFFAQYWGQNIAFFQLGVEVGEFTIKFDSQFQALLNKTEYGWDKVYLELTPLSQITDEDAIELAQYLSCYKSDIINSIKEHLKENHPYGDSLEQPELDYLRSKGYALPWMGLSIEDLVEYGWVKLKEN